MFRWKWSLFAAVCLLMAACSNGHDALSADVQDLGFDDSLEFLVERRIGPEQCFAADCPAITRYYLSDQDPEQACHEVGKQLEGTGVSVDQILGQEACRYLGVIGSLRLDVRATDPISEIPPDGQTSNPFPVTDPHEAMVVVRATRDESAAPSPAQAQGPTPTRQLQRYECGTWCLPSIDATTSAERRQARSPRLTS